MKMTWGINNHPLDGSLPNVLAIIAVVIVVALAACLCMGAAAPVSKYWQDLILKPEQAWIERYGYNNESVLAYNVARIIKLGNAQGMEIQRLKERVARLEADLKPKPVADPNSEGTAKNE